MSVGPVYLNGMIQNTQDVGAMRHQENTRSAVEQQQIQVNVEKKEMSKAQEVQKKDNADPQEGKFDAKEKGSNEYQQNRKKQQKKKEILPDGSVTVKRAHGFDMKI